MFVVLDQHGEDGLDSYTSVPVAQVERLQRRAREFQKKLKRM